MATKILIVGGGLGGTIVANGLCRQLRDAYGAALMVNNDRIMKLNATMLLAHREG